jgi:hypothetical protein
MEHDTNDPLVQRARKRVAMKFGFYVHAAIFVMVNGLLFMINQFSGGGPWHRFPLLGWGLGLAIHGIVVLIAVEGDGMRQRMLDAEVDTLRKRQGK